MAAKETNHSRKAEKPWWKIHEEIAALFERLYRPIEMEIRNDMRQRDIVGTLRQLDVGVIDPASPEASVNAFVEVQKRRSVVGIDDFGNWMYKLNTLNAKEMVVVSEKGFSKSVVNHVKKLYPDTVRLGLLYKVETGFLKKFDVKTIDVKRVLNVWWFASILVQYDDDGEIENVTLPTDTTEKIFGAISPMGLIEYIEREQGERASGRMHTFVIRAKDQSLSYKDRIVKCVVMVAEKQKRIWNPKTLFFTYEEVYPQHSQRGIAVISEFAVDLSRQGKLVLVISPDENNLSGRNAKLSGQFEFT